VALPALQYCPTIYSYYAGVSRTANCLQYCKKVTASAAIHPGAIVGKVTIEDLEAFVRLFDASDWHRVEVEVDDFALVLSKTPASGQQPAIERAVSSMPASSAGRTAARAVSTATPLAPSPAQAIAPEGCVAIRAPHLGTFYRSPKPGAAPYIEVGQTVTAETEVCLLEVMKLFTTLRAGISGVVRAISAKESALVESGDVLFWVEPNS
jgi:acetyl-CoA carboxylase biotin carboxyl carrier protein